MAVPLSAFHRATGLLWLMLAASVLLPAGLFGYLSWRDLEAYLERGAQ